MGASLATTRQERKVGKDEQRKCSTCEAICSNSMYCDGIEQEPSYPPLSGKSSSTSSCLAESSDHPVGNKDTGGSGTSHNLQQVASSTDKEPKHVKLHRPSWVKDLFFSLPEVI